MQEILLVDDHEMIRDGLKQYFIGNDEFQITAEAENGKEAFDLLMCRPFDLVITDINMPVSGGLELMENIRLNLPSQKVLALTMDPDERHIKKLIDLGVQGYILKNVKKTEFLEAIRHICAGQKYFSHEITAKLDKLKSRTGQGSSSKNLSHVEKKVLELLAEECPEDLIAQQLNLSPKIVSLVLKNLYRKANCKSKAGLIIYGIEKGLL